MTRSAALPHFELLPHLRDLAISAARRRADRQGMLDTSYVRARTDVTERRSNRRD
jgi:hypothetical protein